MSLNVLLIGGGVSSSDIARDISPVAKTIYQSTRNGPFDMPATVLPSTASRVPQVEAIETGPSSFSARLQTGLTLAVDRIILCTGYYFTVPFLPQLNRPDLPAHDADDVVLVTDGTQVHNLHRDIFYMPDPTLAFVGVPFYNTTFSLFEFQAVAVAAVFSGVVAVPALSAMRGEYGERVARKGYGRAFHALRGEQEDYVAGLLEWVNGGREECGLEPVEGHSAAWRAEMSHVFGQG